MINKLVVLNGGNLGIACLAMFSRQTDYNISLYSARKAYDTERIRISGILEEEVQVQPCVTELAEAIRDADVLLLTAPAYLHRQQLRSLAPILRPGVWVGALQCSGGFFAIAREELGPQARLWGFQRPPYTARKSECGNTVHILGHKPVNRIALSPSSDEESSELVATLACLLGSEIELCHPIEAMLTNSNPLLHPARLYELQAGEIQLRHYKRKPLFYEEWGNIASELYIRMDEELAALYRALSQGRPKPLGIKSVLEYYEQKDATGLTRKLNSITAFRGITAPCKALDNGDYTLDLESRYFTEDLCYGLTTIKSAANTLGIPTPTIDMVLAWATQLMGEDLSSYEYTFPTDLG